MDIQRALKHLAMTDRQVRQAFPSATLRAIERAIKASEADHSGEVRFAVEGALELGPLWRDQTARERAVELFSQLKIWDTEHNSGVLLYVLLADRQVEILADRGIHARVGSPVWAAICRGMEAKFSTGAFEAGSIGGIEAVTRELNANFPAHSGDRNELPDNAVVL